MMTQKISKGVANLKSLKNPTVCFTFFFSLDFSSDGSPSRDLERTGKGRKGRKEGKERKRKGKGQEKRGKVRKSEEK